MPKDNHPADEWAWFTELGDDITRLTLDHRIPVALGGDDEPENLRTLCKSCNSRKGARV